MNSRVISSFGLRLLLFLVFLVVLWQGLTGCAANVAYHPEIHSPSNCVNSKNSKKCWGSYIQNYSDHTIAIAEFSERGNSFDNKKTEAIIDMLRTKSQKNGVAVIVFVHGWQHNSKEGATPEKTDKNLADFKRTIAEIAYKREDYKLGTRELVGLYVGWRGATVTVPLVRALTFWERKSVAQRLGEGGLAQFLLDLDAIDSTDPRNLMVTIGHSFGGAAVVSALSKPLLGKVEAFERDADSTDYCARTLCGIGDGIYLLNPALEANAVLPLYESALQVGQYSNEQSPLLVSLSSEADLATKFAFPVGQTAGLLATSSQIILQRSYFNKKKTGQQLALDEQYLDSATLGNFSPYLTHRIDVPSVSNACSGKVEANDIQLNACEDYSNSKRCGPKHFPKGLERVPRGAHIDGRSENFPLYFVRTDKNFMKGHNDIFNPHVVAFLTAQLNERVAVSNIRSNYIDGDKVSVSNTNALYTDSEYFTSEYQKALEFSCSFLSDKDAS